MATGIEIANKGVCGAGSLRGFNTSKGCPVPFGEVAEIWRTPADFKFDLTQEFDEAYIKSLQLAGNLTIIKGIIDFPENGSDKVYETLPRGEKAKAGAAIYEFNPLWNQDKWFYKQLGYLEGSYNNRFVFVDTAGNISMTKGKDDTEAMGYLASMTDRIKEIGESAGVSAKQSMIIQLADAKELEDDVLIMSNDLLTFDPRFIDSVVQAHIEMISVPAALDTTIEVSAIIARGMKGFITGATTSGDFKVTIDGVIQPASVAVEAGEKYTITTIALTASNVVNVSFNGVIDIAGDSLYVSNVASKTVV